MTDINWPAALDYHVNKGTFRFTQSENQLRTDFEQGPARSRRRFTRQVATSEFSMSLSAPEFATFKRFFAEDLDYGVNWFNFPIWTGSDYTSHEVRMQEPYTASDDVALDYTRVSVRLEIRNLVLLSLLAACFVGLYGFENLSSWGNTLDTFVNTTYPGLIETVDTL